MPLQVIQRLDLSNIQYHEEANPVGISVQFSDLKHVKTVFRYVRNLPHGQKVSPMIPAVLSGKYRSLLSQAYYIRNGNISHQTVIKFLGNTLALYAKPTGAFTWQLVPDEYAVPSHHHHHHAPAQDNNLGN